MVKLALFLEKSVFIGFYKIHVMRIKNAFDLSFTPPPSPTHVFITGYPPRHFFNQTSVYFWLFFANFLYIDLLIRSLKSIKFL